MPPYVVVLFGLLLIPNSALVVWADIRAGALINPIVMLALLIAAVSVTDATERTRGPVSQ